MRFLHSIAFAIAGAALATIAHDGILMADTPRLETFIVAIPLVWAAYALVAFRPRRH